MSIKLDSRTTGLIPRDLLLGDPGPAPAEGKAKPKELRAMDKPKMLATPETAGPRLSQRASGEIPKLKQRSQALLQSIRTAGPQQLSAAQAAMVAAASYSLRRSKGARRSAIELLEAVAEHVPELSVDAQKLRHVLIAEGYLHRCDADSTLRAIRALVGMLQEEKP